jgi:hypothetical protein
LIIYVSGKLSAPTEEEKAANVLAAIDVGLELHLKGHIPYIPHLNVLMEPCAEKRQIEVTYADYLTWDLAILERCDALFLCSRSPGADLEHGMAKTWGLPVFYNLADVPDGNLKLPK